jgi:hypothetical protein
VIFWATCLQKAVLFNHERHSAQGIAQRIGNPAYLRFGEKQV